MMTVVFLMRRKLRFSLRVLMAIVTLNCLGLGWREVVRRQQIATTESLEQMGAFLYDRFADPIGPDCVWGFGRSINSLLSHEVIPQNVLFDDGIANSPLCITGYFACRLDGPEFDRGHLKLAGNLRHLEKLELIDCKIDFCSEDLALLSRLTSLRILRIESDALTSAVVRRLAVLKQLDFLSIVSKNINDLDVKELRQSLRNCRIEWSNSS